MPSLLKRDAYIGWLYLPLRQLATIAPAASTTRR